MACSSSSTLRTGSSNLKEQKNKNNSNNASNKNSGNISNKNLPNEDKKKAQTNTNTKNIKNNTSLTNSYVKTKNAYNNFTNKNQIFYKKLKTKTLLNKNKEKDRDFHEKLSSTMNNFRKNNYTKLGYSVNSISSYTMKKQKLKNQKNNNDNISIRNSNSAKKRRSMGNYILDHNPNNLINFAHKKNNLSMTIKPDKNDDIKRTGTFNKSVIIPKKLEKKDSFIDINTIEDSYKESRDQQKINLSQLKKNKNLSYKECAYYILATSPILRLTERLIFSGSTAKIRNVISKTDVLKSHSIYLKNKINELQNEIILCNNTISTAFVATKIADITLNFITSNDEQEFKEFELLNSDKSNNLILYYNFIKILYYLFGEHLDRELNDQKLKSDLFEKLKLKGYLYIKDYLYAFFIKQKDVGFVIEKIDEVNKIVKKYPELLEFHESNRICRFICFTSYLIKEVINYSNNIRDTMELKNKAQNFLEIVVEIYNKFQAHKKDVIE